ncbi:bifunctional UDP-sugar hydrolase/5'-nucleotidase UshA [Marinibactrum halimedae]|uniref:Bifunctional metallophosphatase/5'-nucleotidase n=1 Tax=Marinibactrum halimedae TaxID=1444977 RepID=A0AA37T974_9GAMM|nr:bifunctional UDP-sugar hydrolase/5'-nucleotidase UshA [Marinibactrum halimedae]MCD9457586.1 bifunctional UDP-sugar hydrolase/5'-nucleotidase UshA [Marinibactrum halimedae]GLS28006.1 bifunctional metallophosphatase/5'-nucleotidase [Marinibactrum halimedae]
MAETAPEPSIRLTILHTNDHHGRFWHNQHGEYGLAARKTVVDTIRKEVSAQGGYTLLLSGGDINTGVPESDHQDAEPDFKGMNWLGYDAMAVGNHEFDNPLKVLRKQQQWAEFPFLAANIYNRKGQRLFDPYKIFSFGGIDIAVIGLTTHETANIGNPNYIKRLRFRMPEVEAFDILEEVNTRSHVQIALTHMGHHEYDIGSDVTLAESVEGLDLIVGGHSAEVICVDERKQLLHKYSPGTPCRPDRRNGTWIVQAQEWGRYVGRMDLQITGRKVKLLNYQLIPINLTEEIEGERQFIGEYIQPDQELQAFLNVYQQRGMSSLQQPLTVTSDTFLREDRSRFPNSSPLGVLLSRSLMMSVGADVAIYNAGGIRDGFTPGIITRKAVLQVTPFNNKICYVDLSGKELIDYLSNAEIFPSNQMGAEFAGFTLTNNGTQIVLTKTGQPIDLGAQYRLALSSYLAAGGDNFPPVTKHSTFVNTRIDEKEALYAFLKQHDILSLEDF